MQRNDDMLCIGILFIYAALTGDAEGLAGAGASEGAGLGVAEGSAEGSGEGTAEGSEEGSGEGAAEGSEEGSGEGSGSGSDVCSASSPLARRRNMVAASARMIFAFGLQAPLLSPTRMPQRVIS